MRKILTLIFYIASLIVTTIHELGHAVAALLLYKEKVTVYLGCNNDTEGKRIQVGRLVIYFNTTTSSWFTGSCSVDDGAPFSINRLMLFHLGGPLASLTVLLLCSMLLFFKILPAFIILPCFILAFFLFTDVTTSITWNKDDGNYMTDGRTIYDMLRRKKYYLDMHQLDLFSRRKEYRNGICYFHSIDNKDPDLYRHVFALAEKGKLFYEGERIIHEWKQAVKPGPDEYGVWAYFYFVNGEHEKCLKCCDEVIALDPKNGDYYNWKARFLLDLERYDEALTWYDMSLALLEGTDGVYVLSLRGYCKLKLKRYDEAKQDFDVSFAMKPDNSYLHMHYGIYYLETGDKAQAKISFQKAYELDKETEGLEKYL